MEISFDDQGRYDVRFDGVLHNSCRSDLDCFGELICILNESWSQYPELCVCPLTLGRAGSTCQELNVSGWVLVAISSLALGIAWISFFIGCLDFWNVQRTARIRERVPRHSALFTTLVLSIIASFCIGLQTIYQIVSHFVPRTAIVTTVGGETSKQSILIFFNLATTTLSVFFAISAALNVSLVLIEIADRVAQGSTKVHVNVFVYRKFLLAYVATFGVLIIAFAAVGKAEWTFAAAAPAVFFIAFTFFIGWLRLRRLFRLNDVTSTGATLSKVQSAMRNIRITALGISLGATGMIICGILQVVLDPLNRPDGSFAAIPGRAFWVFSAVVMLLLVRYTHVHVSGKQDKRSSQPDITEPIGAVVINQNTPA